MIVGTVTADHEAIIRIFVRDSSGHEHDQDALIDTGFNGWLCLPPDLIAAWGLRWQRIGRARLADGSEILFDIYEATVIWDGQARTVPVDEADTDPLVGMALIHGYELNLQAVDGGAVTLRRIAP
jgi:clan AA aspartic protease